ncbi:MAG TPA: TetR/AcrR family transcriptional regulator [Sphingomonadaceae bacterium]|nr:TetR/AcrR family transcriptional regulator [Sphingomonadaceae bacterium]
MVHAGKGTGAHDAARKRSGRRRTQEERSAETRESLIAAAIEVLAEVGYVSGTTAAIAERASVSRGAIQYHFESKDDLIVAIMETIAIELNFRFDVTELATRPVEVRLDRMIEHYWRVFQSPMFRAGLSIWVALAGDAALAARVEATLRGLREHILVVWRELFRDVPCAERKLDAIRHIVMAALRGTAIAFMGGRGSTNFIEERRVLREMALHALQTTGGEGT